MSCLVVPAVNQGMTYAGIGVGEGSTIAAQGNNRARQGMSDARERSAPHCEYRVNPRLVSLGQRYEAPLHTERSVQLLGWHGWCRAMACQALPAGAGHVLRELERAVGEATRDEVVTLWWLLAGLVATPCEAVLPSPSGWRPKAEVLPRPVHEVDAMSQWQRSAWRSRYFMP